jgi:hypothetical protein
LKIINFVKGSLYKVLEDVMTDYFILIKKIQSFFNHNYLLFFKYKLKNVINNLKTKKLIIYLKNVKYKKTLKKQRQI